MLHDHGGRARDVGMRTFPSWGLPRKNLPAHACGIKIPRPPSARSGTPRRAPRAIENTDFRVHRGSRKGVEGHFGVPGPPERTPRVRSIAPARVVRASSSLKDPCGARFGACRERTGEDTRVEAPDRADRTCSFVAGKGQHKTGGGWGG